MAHLIWESGLELTQQGEPFVVVTMLSHRGHAPQDPGAKVIVTKTGLHCGTVGGGKIEAHCIRYALHWLEKNDGPSQPRQETWNLQKDIGMSCGGEATFLFELELPHAWQIAVFGAGHVAQALVSVLEALPAQVTVMDSRSEWLDKMQAHPRRKKVCHAHPAELVERFSSDTYFVTMTQGHTTDLPILEKILKTHPRPTYVGAIGSPVKATKLRADLRERGIDNTTVEQLHCPIGLPIGTNDPGEIAISIAAQLIQERDRSNPNQKKH